MIFSNQSQITYRSNQKPKIDIQFMQFSNNINRKPIINNNHSVREIVTSNSFKQDNNESKAIKSMTWGEPTWFLFHTLAEKVKNENFVFIRKELLNLIYSICSNLPCPICTNHATTYLNSVNFNSIQTKQQLKDLLFVFHNEVNTRKGHPFFDYKQLDEKYSKANTNLIINNFINSFSNKHKNMKLIADDFIRTKIVQKMSEWFYNNISHFSS